MGTKTDLEIFGLIAKEMGLNLGSGCRTKYSTRSARRCMATTFRCPVIATGGAAPTLPLNGRVAALPGVIQSASEPCLPRAPFRRYSKILNEVMEAPGELYGGQGPGAGGQ